MSESKSVSWASLVNCVTGSNFTHSFILLPSVRIPFHKLKVFWCLHALCNANVHTHVHVGCMLARWLSCSIPRAVRLANSKGGRRVGNCWQLSQVCLWPWTFPSLSSVMHPAPLYTVLTPLQVNPMYMYLWFFNIYECCAFQHHHLCHCEFYLTSTIRYDTNSVIINYPCFASAMRATTCVARLPPIYLASHTINQQHTPFT